jgi:2-haloacid dehalogenase
VVTLSQIKAIVFDAYGTLFDVHSIIQKADEFFPGQGKMISEIWRQKQLEYSWLRSLMGCYKQFWYVSDDALSYSLRKLGLGDTLNIRTQILEEYLSLQPFAEVEETLHSLKNISLTILSNGNPEMLLAVVENAGLTGFFAEIISVDQLKIYKPVMDVYQLAPDKLGVEKEEILFVTSNSWDASGAKSFGFHVCWVNRNNEPFDELNVQPDVVVSNLKELENIL